MTHCAARRNEDGSEKRFANRFWENAQYKKLESLPVPSPIDVLKASIIGWRPRIATWWNLQSLVDDNVATLRTRGRGVQHTT